MLTYLPIVCLVVALVALIARDGASGKPPEGPRPEAPAGAYIVLAMIAVGAIIAGWHWEAVDGAMPSALGFAVGSLLSAVSYALGLLSSQRTAGRAAPIAIGVLGASCMTFFHPWASMTMVFGAAVSAWMLSIGKQEEPNPWAMRSAIVAAAAIAVNALGASSALSSDAKQAGVIFGLVAAIAAVLGPGIGSVLKSKDAKSDASFLSQVLAVVILIGGGYLVGDKWLHIPEAWMIFNAGALLGLIVNWIMPESSEPNTFRITLCSLIWVAAATSTFSFLKGFGMALALLGGACVLLIAGNRRALLSLGPLASLVFYRVFRESHTDASKALDIGQHYAMIGILIGAILPVMAQEWLRTAAKKVKGSALIAGSLWILLLMGIPIAAAILLGAKGIIGYMVGLGLAAVLEAARGERSAHSLSLALGLGAMMNLMYEWLAPNLDLERKEKLVWLAWLGGGILILGILIAVFSGELTSSEEKKGQPA